MKPNNLHQTAAHWHDGQTSALYARVPLDMREATIIMQDLVVGITGGFIDE